MEEVPRQNAKTSVQHDSIHPSVISATTGPKPAADMLQAGGNAARQLVCNGPGWTHLWGAASSLLQAAPSSISSISTTACTSAWKQQQHTRHATQQQQHHHHQQQQVPQVQQQQQQQQPSAGWLQQLSGASKQELLSAISQLTIRLQGQAVQYTAASLLPQAALAMTAAAASAAAVPAGASLAYFQGTRYQGSNSLTSPGRYWLRQMGLDDSRVTAVLVAINVGCFGMQQISTTFTSLCVRIGYKVAAGEYWRLLTAAFVHGGLLHAGINTLALWNMGRMIEPQLGSTPFLAVYLGSAVSGNLLGYYMSTGFSMSMGSSSALFGLLGAYLASSYINRRSVYVSRAQVVSVLQTLGINMALMLFFGGHMDNWAHLGGFAGGAVIAAAIGPRFTR